MQMDTGPISARPAPRGNKKPGFFSKVLGIADPVTVSRMASYRYGENGAFVVALENGQEWRQADILEGKPNWLKKPSAYMVTISYGSFGTYSLGTSDAPGAYKVERLK